MWIITAWQHMSPEVIVKGFKKCYVSTAVCYRKTVKRIGVLKWVWARWSHWLWRWRQWHWLVKIRSMWHALCIKYMQFIVKYFFLADILFLKPLQNYRHRKGDMKTLLRIHRQASPYTMYFFFLNSCVSSGYFDYGCPPLQNVWCVS